MIKININVKPIDFALHPKYKIKLVNLNLKYREIRYEKINFYCSRSRS